MEIRGQVETVSAETTSGNIRIDAEKADDLKISSTSGGVTVVGGQVRKCKIGSTSGNICAEIREGDQMETGSTSGNIQITLRQFSMLKASATSGAITAELPQEPGFTAKIESTSGGIDYNMRLTRNGDRFICGNGSGQVEIGTTSGHIQLNEAAGE